MSKPAPLDRHACFYAFWPSTEADALAALPWHELKHIAQEPRAHPVTAAWAPWDRNRLLALVRLCELYYPSQLEEPIVLTGAGDVLRRFAARLRCNRDRVVMLACLDVHASLTDEVLVQLGGDTLAPPPLRSLLRHALFKGAHALYVVDYRPVEVPVVDARAARAFDQLARLGEVAGIDVRDWVIVGMGGAGSVREGVRQPGTERAKAA